MGTRKASDGESQLTYTLNVTTDSTQVPDWLLLCNRISHPARILAGVILMHQKNGDEPKKATLADDLAVDERSITRWLTELKVAKILVTKRDGRNNYYSFLKPRKTHIQDQVIRDQLILDQSISDQSISDQVIRDRLIPYSKQRSRASESPMTARGTRTSAPISHGGGGGHDSHEDSDPPTPTNARVRVRILPSDITTDTGRWMVREGFNIVTAHKLQHLPLAACQADFARRLQLGQRHGAIGQAWEVEAPAAPPIVQVEQPIFDLDELPGPPPGARSIDDAQALYDRRRTARGKR